MEFLEQHWVFLTMWTIGSMGLGVFIVALLLLYWQPRSQHRRAYKRPRLEPMHTYHKTWDDK